MKIKVYKAEMVDALQSIQAACDSRNTLPILANVLIEAAGDNLTMTATDLELTAAHTVAVKVEAEGRTTLPLKRLLAICKEMEMSEIEIDVQNHIAAITSGGSSFRLHGMGAESFPDMPTVPAKSKAYTVDQEALANALRKTHYAASADFTRENLCGVQLRLWGGDLTATATDGRRLAIADCECDPGYDATMLIPIKAVRELMRALVQGSVTIRASANLAEFDLGFMRIVTRLIGGSYPDVQQVIPTGERSTCMIHRGDMLSALKRATLMTTDQESAVTIDIGGGNMTISARAEGIGQASEAIEIEGDGEVVIAFNPRYLVEGLHSMHADQVSFEFGDAIGAVTIKTDGLIYVVMPVRAV